jgi:hypothetical protein
MKLLKLVPDNTNVDFMKRRNVALTLSILPTIGSLVRTIAASTWASTLLAASARPAQQVNIRPARQGWGSRRRGEHPGIRRQPDTRSAHLSPPGRAAANQVVTAVRA